MEKLSKKNWGKILSFGIIILIIFGGYLTALGNCLVSKNIKEDLLPKKIFGIAVSSHLLVDEELDQSQDRFSGTGWHCVVDEMFAQSLTIGKDSMGLGFSCYTKIYLYMWKIGNPGLLKISMRTALDGKDITWKTISCGQVSTSPQWIEIDFPDTDLRKIMYIIWNPVSDCDEDNNYLWGCGRYNPYHEGEAWYYDGNKWSIYDDPKTQLPDFCFQTYGYAAIRILDDPPVVPKVIGPESGEAGSAYSYLVFSPGEKYRRIYYEIDWGDGSPPDETQFCDPNAGAIKNHSWNKPGRYEIKARSYNIYNKLSNWSSLIINMPKSVLKTEDYDLLQKKIQSELISFKDSGNELVLGNCLVSKNINEDLLSKKFIIFGFNFFSRLSKSIQK